jgi:hypothetical protein
MIKAKTQWCDILNARFLIEIIFWNTLSYFLFFSIAFMNQHHYDGAITSSEWIIYNYNSNKSCWFFLYFFHEWFCFFRVLCQLEYDLLFYPIVTRIIHLSDFEFSISVKQYFLVSDKIQLMQTYLILTDSFTTYTKAESGLSIYRYTMKHYDTYKKRLRHLFLKAIVTGMIADMPSHIRTLFPFLGSVRILSCFASSSHHSDSFWIHSCLRSYRREYNKGTSLIAIM